MRLNRSAFSQLPRRRVRVAGAGLAVLGVVSLSLAAVPACGGGGSTGENAVHLQAAVAPAALAVAGGAIAPNCGGGGGTGDD